MDIVINTTRRGLFKAAAALGLAAPCMGVATPVQADELTPATSAMAEKLIAAIKSFADARARKLEVKAVYDRLAPAIPDALVLTHPRCHFYSWEFETDVEGLRVYIEPVESHISRKIADLRGLRNDLTKHVPGGSVHDDMQHLIAVAEDHERACQQAKDISGIEAAIAAEWFAGDALRAVCREVRLMSVHDFNDLAIKAKAMHVYGTTVETPSFPNATAQHAAASFGPVIANDVLQLFEMAGVA